MTTPLRLSPIHDCLLSLKGTGKTLHGMPSLLSLPTQIEITDLSLLTRFGVKGAKAGEWLSQQGLPIPEHPNSWHPLPSGGIIARLGLTEFLIEDEAIAPHLAMISENPPAKVYPVLRQDLALGLRGDRLPDLLRQTCSFNFQALSLDERPVILTSMIGVAVTVIPGEHNGQPFYRIWCDGTFGVYFWHTLTVISHQSPVTS